MAPLMRAALVGLVPLIVWAGGAKAACSDADAHAKAQEFGRLAKQKMASKPDEMGDLAAEFGDTMAATAGHVTERTCVELDGLVRKAKAL